MKSTLPKGVHAVKRGDKTYYYWRATKKRLPDNPDSQEFQRALKDAEKEAPAEQARQGTLSALITEYRKSPHYLNLRPTSRKAYERALNRLAALGPAKVDDLKRSHFLKIADRLSDRPGLLKEFLTVSRVLMRFSVEREYREYNPLAEIKMPKLGEHKRWPDAAIKYALEHFDEPYRRAIMLALYTGQRQGDCLRMTWAQYDGQGIEVIQGKTGVKVWIPIHRDFKDELNRWKSEATATTILTAFSGRPWQRLSFSVQFSRKVWAAPELEGLVFHGLRKSAAAKLAEAGCTTHEIAAITGHQSLKEVERYTREADQKNRAIAAIHKLETRQKRDP